VNFSCAITPPGLQVSYIKPQSLSFASNLMELKHYKGVSSLRRSRQTLSRAPCGLAAGRTKQTERLYCDLKVTSGILKD